MNEKLTEAVEPLDVASVKDIPYEIFFDKFLKLNAPCLIENVARNWDSSTLWTVNEKPHFDYLRSKYGNSEITIYKCNEKYYNSQSTCQMQFKDFLNYWEDYIRNGYSEDLPIYYLKDWHLRNEFIDDCFYTTPIYFSSDWLNEYLTSSNMDDYRFVYMGPKGSWTPFHKDVFTSYSWSANICGTKRWLLFPPGEEKKLLDDLGNLPYDVKDIPGNVKCFDVIQLPGDAIFVPSGWYHQVFNLEDTISINHNWINGCNIKLMWNAMEDEFSSIKKEISDCENMDNFSEQCQLILKSTFGMNFEDFFKFIHFITLKRMTELVVEPRATEHCEIYSRIRFIIFDLKSIEEVLHLLIGHEELEKSQELRDMKKSISKIIGKINNCINSKT